MAEVVICGPSDSLYHSEGSTS